ncbi:TIGR03086 family metal-binding protein [Actinomadura meridiana]|uniref:TIGR03086 family metal-binding protein n=1 Tax=Actinomadura meridiana TaxID=559626 RepID=A0ABP8C132_9ACTN
MSSEQSTVTANAVELVERAFDTTNALLAAVPDDRWDASSPCGGWTVRQVGNHLVGSLAIIEAYTREDAEAIAVAETDRETERDLDGAHPAKAFGAAADSCLDAVSAFGALDREVPFVIGEVPGVFLTRVCLLESLVHGWDVARGASTPYDADGDVVDAVAVFAKEGPIEKRRTAGFFGPGLPVGPDAPAFTRLLALLGRQA